MLELKSLDCISLDTGMLKVLQEKEQQKSFREMVEETLINLQKITLTAEEKSAFKVLRKNYIIFPAFVNYLFLPDVSTEKGLSRLDALILLKIYDMTVRFQDISEIESGEDGFTVKLSTKPEGPRTFEELQEVISEDMSKIEYIFMKVIGLV